MAGRGVDIKLGGAPGTKESYDEIKELGGLFVLGTERHEARRIDNQLRGRSGRQGDPGETQFFVSLEDYLMRNFAGNDFIKKMMDRFKIPDDMPIETSVVSRSLETAQTKIEGWYFDSRKHVFEFDNVLNQQRLKVYRDRRKVLVGGDEDMESFYQALMSFAQTVTHFDADGSEAQQDAPKSDAEALDQKRKQFESLENGTRAFLRVLRTVMLQAIDTFWIEHLETMDHLRSSVGLRAYGQRDPLVEYKKEGHRLFKEMEFAINAQVLQVLLSIDMQGSTAVAESISTLPTPTLVLHNPAAATPFGADISGAHTSESSSGPTVVPVISGQEKVGRNDPCPCGSGKKYKKCHGIGQ
jgi:preprotein translocase subunit SecA